VMSFAACRRLDWQGRGMLACSLAEKKEKTRWTKLVKAHSHGPPGLAVLTIIVLSVVPGQKCVLKYKENDYYEHFARVFHRQAASWPVGYLRPMQFAIERRPARHMRRRIGSSLNCGFPGGPHASAISRLARLVAWIGLLVIVVVRRAHETQVYRFLTR